MRDRRHRLGPWLERFFLEHIVTERNLARNTQLSYRDAFVLLLPFISGILERSVDRLFVSEVSSRLVLQFLQHLEEDRDCTVHTRNQRLMAIRAFARFVGSREPALVGWSGQIRAIPVKKATPRSIFWLTRQEVQALFAVPNRNTERGQVEHALLRFLYNTGARASEAAGVEIANLQLGSRNGRHSLATLHGKGGKIRNCPLLPTTARVLKKLVGGRPQTETVFLSRYRKPFSRSGVYQIVKRCAKKAPALADKRVTPHLLRHSIACHLVEAGVDINTIRSWLGHCDLATTNVYARITLKSKAEAIALCDTDASESTRSWKEDKGLMARLKSL